MLYQVGPLRLDTFPMEVNKAKRSHAADFAKHDVLNARKPYEAVGPGEDSLNLTGSLRPFHIGGLSELQLAHQLVDAQDPLFVMRGDGRLAAWYVLMNIEEGHEILSPTGVGFEVSYDLKLERVPAPSGPEVGSGLMSTLVSIFG